MNAKNNLLPSVFEDLKEFLSSGSTKEPTYKCTENQFIVSFDSEEELEEDVIEKIEEEESNHYVEEEVAMTVEEETEPYFEIETVNEESEAALTDQEFFVPGPTEVDIKNEFKASSSGKAYECECGAQLSNLNEFQRHMNQHKRKSSSNPRLVCCDVSFKDAKYYEIHVKAHENFEAIAPHLQTFACNNCRIMFSNEDDLSCHDGQCDLDETVLIERRSAFDDHMVKRMEKPMETQPDEDDEEIYSCGHCGKKLSEMNLKVHLLFFHTLIAFCPHDNRCFEGVKQVRLFSDHIRNKHPELFAKDHLYNCRYCDRNFTTNFEKLAHMKKCDRKLFACENHCNKRFATEWLLKNHMKIVYGEDRFTCEICNKRCVSKSDLQIHSRCHTNERPYSCSICDKSFKTSANRSSHMDIHQSEKRHECETCGKFAIFIKKRK